MTITLAPDRRDDPARLTRWLRPRRPPDIVVRELRGGEVDVLDTVFAGLSARSRYLRFHGGTPRMTPPTRRALAAVDGRNHVAVAAFVGGEAVGIARLVAVGKRRAELAIEVVDAHQGRGIGRRLLHAVAALGRAAGCHEAVADVLTENRAVRALLASVLPILSSVTVGSETTVTVALQHAVPTVGPLPALHAAA